MSFWLSILVLAFAAAAVLFVYLQFIVPFRHLREALRRLAAYDFRPVLMSSRWGPFRETSGYVRRLSELLQQLDRQIADEGFSLRAILSSMVEGVLITDRSQRVRLANEALYRMFNLGSAILNRSVIEVFRSPELQQAIGRALETGTSRRIEISLPSGLHLEVYAGVLNPKSLARPLGAVVVFHDVTALKNLETVRREFVANVSHEFRTPLTIIMGYIETLLDGALEDRAMSEKSLRVMHKNGQRLTLLIEDLLTISRMEQRIVQLDYHPVNVCDLLAHVLERMESAVAERNAVVSLHCPPEGLPVEIDPRRVEQVFANLLENALRYGAVEGLRVDISARKEGDEVEIAFSDNGPGIPFNDQPHIFERFYRVHKDRSRVAGGTGLGLSIVKNVVQAHGGKVSLQSTPGEGATFRVLLPVKPSSPRFD